MWSTNFRVLSEGYLVLPSCLEDAPVVFNSAIPGLPVFVKVDLPCVLQLSGRSWEMSRITRKL